MKPSGDNIPGSTVVNATFGPMYEPSLFVVLPYLGSEDYMFKTTSQQTTNHHPNTNCPLHNVTDWRPRGVMATLHAT